MTNELNLARAFAYKYLKEWLDKYKANNYKQSFMADYEMVTDVLSKRGALKSVTYDKEPTQKEYLAAMLLETVIIIESNLETGEAFEVYDGDTVLETLKLELEGRKSALSELELNDFKKHIAKLGGNARAAKDPRTQALNEIEKEYRLRAGQFKRRGYQAAFTREMHAKYPIIEDPKSITTRITELNKQKVSII